MLWPIFTDVSFIKPEDSLNPLFKAIHYSGKVCKFVNSSLPKMHIGERGGRGGGMRYISSVSYVQRVLFLTYSSEIDGMVVEIIMLLNAT